MVWLAALTGLRAAAAANSSPAALLTYAPILVAIAALATAIISALSRRDKKSVDAATTLDARTNTAIRGLTEAYDRLDLERAREVEGRVEAERVSEEQAVRIHELETENEQLKKQLRTKQGGESW